MSASDDSRAIRLIRRRFWWYLALFAPTALLGLSANISDSRFYTLLFVVMAIGMLRPSFSDRALRMLPVSKDGFATTLWQFTVGYPVAVIAEVSVLHALYWIYSGDAWSGAWGRAAYSFSWFLLVDAVSVAGAVLGFAWTRVTAEHDTDVRSNWSTQVDWRNVFKLSLVMLFILYVLAYPEFYGGPHTKLLVVNLIVGGAAFVASYLFREKLIAEHPRSATEEARRVESGLVWATPGRDPWIVALLKHMSGTTVWSMYVSGLTLVVCMIMLCWPDYRSEPDSLVGIINGAAIVNISFVWFPWNAELRAWRMLPLSRAQLGAAVVGFVAVSCLAPWVLVFLVLGSLLAGMKFLTFNILFSLLGLSIVVQGAALVVLPATLRGPRKGILLLAVLVVAWIFSFFFFGFLLFAYREISQTNLTSHGWLWMTMGIIVLCAGIPIAGRRAGRVLRRDDCYQKATEWSALTHEEPYIHNHRGHRGARMRICAPRTFFFVFFALFMVGTVPLVLTS
jgi:hypothetical protein